MWRPDLGAECSMWKTSRRCCRSCRDLRRCACPGSTRVHVAERLTNAVGFRRGKTRTYAGFRHERPLDDDSMRAVFSLLNSQDAVVARSGWRAQAGPTTPKRKTAGNIKADGRNERRPNLFHKIFRK